MFSIDHLGIAVKSLAAAKGIYEKLGLSVSAEEVVIGGLRQIMEAITKLQPIKPEPAPPPEPKPAGSLLWVSEVALIIGITEDTVRKWARAGKITSVRLS